MAARVQVINEVTKQFPGGDWTLCFQWCLYVYDDGTSENGYRFIWRRPDNSLQAARGQARLPSVKDIEELINAAQEEGWAEHQGD